MSKRDDRFIRTYEQSSFGSSVEIWVDRETGVNYLYHNSGYGYGGGMTPLLKPDGTPVVTPVKQI